MNKSILIMILVLTVSMSFGQSLMHKRTKSFLKLKGDKIRQEKELTIIWEDDFSDTSLWVPVYDDTNPNDGPWVIGTEGPSGFYSEGMGPIESTTADNGFAMYDSDATGVEAGSQDSKLIWGGSIDCSAYASVAVAFESYYRAYNGACYIEVSTDSSTWEQFQVHDDIGLSSSTINPYDVTVNLTDYAAGEASVYFRFRYIGEWDYAWMVDDVKFFVPPDHDLQLMDARVNFFEYPHYVDPVSYPASEWYGYSGFYGQIPKRVLLNENATMVFDGIVKNMGSADATPGLSISVTDPSGDEVFTNATTLNAPLASEEKDTLGIVDQEYVYTSYAFSMGTYTWNFTASENDVSDENPVDNTIGYQTEVTDYMYAHDNGNVTGGWSTENYVQGGNDGDIVGVKYQFFEEETIEAANVYISSLTSLGTSFIAKLFILDADDYNYEWVEFMSSSVVNIDDSTDIGTFHNVEFPSPGVVVPEDGFAEVIVAVEYYYGEGERFRVGMDASAPTNGHETVFCIMDDQWYYIGRRSVAVIQAELTYSPLGVSDSMNELTNFSVYPNPTSGTATISNVEGATIEVYNMLGKRVRMIENAEFQTDINLSDMAEGTYLVRVKTDKGIGMKKLNVVK
ncbi:MAG: T9SS type A sorting domain-containing protein [Bacteroidales bacterium]